MLLISAAVHVLYFVLRSALVLFFFFFYDLLFIKPLFELFSYYIRHNKNTFLSLGSCLVGLLHTTPYHLNSETEIVLFACGLLSSPCHVIFWHCLYVWVCVCVCMLVFGPYPARHLSIAARARQSAKPLPSLAERAEPSPNFAELMSCSLKRAKQFRFKIKTIYSRFSEQARAFIWANSGE